MAYKYKVTRVYNKTGVALPVGFLGENGVTIAASGYFDHPGILENDLNAKEIQALQAMLVAGQVDLLLIDTAETDGVWTDEVLFRKTFPTGKASYTLYAASAVPTKLQLVDAWIHVHKTGAKSNKGRKCRITIKRGANAAFPAMLCGVTAVAANGILRWSSLVNTYATLTTGSASSLVVAITGITGMPAGEVYIKAIRIP